MIRVSKAITDYLNWLIKWKDRQIIKVVTGVRRFGKSTLFEIYQDYLLQNGADESQIIAANFEDLEYEDLLDYKSLYQYVKERLLPDFGIMKTLLCGCGIA